MCIAVAPAHSVKLSVKLLRASILVNGSKAKLITFFPPSFGASLLFSTMCLTLARGKVWGKHYIITIK